MSLTEAKTQTRTDADLTIDDADFELWIQGAREQAEGYMHRSLMPQTWQYKLWEFPPSGMVRLPMGPLIELVEVYYLDTDGNKQVMDGTDRAQLLFGADDEPPWVLFRKRVSTLCTPDAVSITYRAGYPGRGSPSTDDDPSGIPASFKVAMRFLIGHWYANRELVQVDARGVPTEIPWTFERALDQYRIYFP